MTDSTGAKITAQIAKTVHITVATAKTTGCLQVMPAANEVNLIFDIEVVSRHAVNIRFKIHGKEHVAKNEKRAKKKLQAFS